MEFGLTSRVIERAKINKLQPIKEIDYRFIWEVNYANICGKMLLIIVNPDTRYSMIYCDLKPSVWKHLDNFLHQAVEHAFLNEGFSFAEINTYFKLAGEVKLTKTHGKKSMGGMNHLTTYLSYYEKILVDGMYQKLITDDCNTDLCNVALHPECKYVEPKEFFVKRMKELISENNLIN